MVRKPAAAPMTLALEGDLDVFSIHLQWEKTLPLFTSVSGSAALDLSAIGDLDLSGVQLLCALNRDLRAKGIQLTVAGAQADWRTRFTPLGLAHLLDGGPA